MDGICFHCGDDIIGKPIQFEDKPFCCSGCKTVYQILSENELNTFYNLEANAGVKPKEQIDHKYAFLDIPEIESKYIDFKNDDFVQVTLSLPTIHCSSCIYLLENLHKINNQIIECEVHFTKRIAIIRFASDFNLSELASLLDSIGYPPNFSSQKESIKKKNKTYLYKLGIAGFAFGSIMLWTFPEYLGIEQDNPEIRTFSSYLSFLVSIPVLLYSANEYLISAYKVIKNKSINLDVPISIGIIALYGQSLWEIFVNNGPGYMDSFAGFIFFLLIGKWFQSKTYDSLDFERDYSSYFPVAVTKLNNDQEEIIELEKLQENDLILLRNNEVLPGDSTLVNSSCKIDYSFVTGESDLVSVNAGDLIYAGGKIVGPTATFKVLKTPERSKLIQLWNRHQNDISEEERKPSKTAIYFLLAVLTIAILSSIYWFIKDANQVVRIVVSILIVACPCALALSEPFTYGNIMRALGRKGLYLKNVAVIPALNRIKEIVFDKTGTLTSGNEIDHIEGELELEEVNALMLLTNSNTHPLSRKIIDYLKVNYKNDNSFHLDEFNEISGKGVSGKVNGSQYKLGSAKFCLIEDSPIHTTSYFTKNNQLVAKIVFKSKLRSRISEMIPNFNKNYDITLLSGDNEKDAYLMQSIFGSNSKILFNQSPDKKVEYIDSNQSNEHPILMIGDGLNDSAALSKASVGIAVSEDIFQFTPNADAIISGTSINQLDNLLHISSRAKLILSICYVFSVLYNVVGLAFAISGNLTPLIAAILMPISSITIVFISTILSRLLTK